MDTSFRQIAIVGLGLMGGSWAAALRRRGDRGQITGCDRPDTIQAARAAGLIDCGAEDAAEAVRAADLVVVAAPVGAILDLLAPLRAAVPAHALITDVGSTKRVICQRARELFDTNPLFLGGHPMAGREGSGLGQADARLFENAPYALTPLTPDHLTDPRAQAFSSLLEALGARPFVTEPSAHDRAVAFLSHLPQLLSTALSSLVKEQGVHEFVPLELAASGFRDMTRLAGSPYALWRDICLTNIENIQSALESLIEKLEAMKLHLSDRELEREFHRAAKLREELRRLG